jgi:hypothetical protein
MISFKKGEKTWVPPAAVPFAIAIGAVPLEGTIADENFDPIPQDPKQPVTMSAEERKQKIYAAFEQLLLRSNRGDFTASGNPHVKKLSDIVGFDVGPGERDEMWVAYNMLQQQPTE